MATTLKFQLFVYLSCILLINCNQGEKSGYITIHNSTFRDVEGRQIILNGLNHVNKNPKENNLDPKDEELFKFFRQHGFNCIRFGLNWAKLEPEPGVINKDYLKEVDKRVKWAEENNLLLLLDMHQDLYGIKFGGGAPLWASLDDDLPHVIGEVWSDAYLFSPAVHRSFNNFWKNKPASDGVGIKDHYIKVWMEIARRYASCTSIIGFDIMNEPFMGDDANKVMPLLLQGYANILRDNEGVNLDTDQLAELWASEESRMKALDYLNKEEIFSKVLNSVTEHIDKFEQGELSLFYQEVRDSIRTINKNHILFLEHNYFCNMGIKSTFIIPKDESGKPDPLCVYAPHAYDLVTDTKDAQNPGTKRVNYILKQIKQAGKEKSCPLVLGEWGAYYLSKSSYLEPAKQIVSDIEMNLYGQTYWAYWDKLETQDYFPTLSRIYPMAINGDLISYNNKFEEKKFSCVWEEKKEQSISYFYVPNRNDIKDIKLTPTSKIEFIGINNTESAYLLVSPLKEVSRTLHIQY